MGEVRKATAEPPPRRDEDSTLGALLQARASVRPSEASWVALVQAIAAGDQRALHALYAQAHRLVFTLMVRITRNRETAEELTIDVFHDVWRKASSYDPSGGSVVGWLLNQARSRAIDRVRYAQRKKRTGDPTGGLAPAAASTPEDALLAEEKAVLLQAALKVLTAQEREAIETAFFSELSYAETAVRLDVPEGTVKTRIRSGLGKLRGALKASGGPP